MLSDCFEGFTVDELHTWNGIAVWIPHCVLADYFTFSINKLKQAFFLWCKIRKFNYWEVGCIFESVFKLDNPGQSGLPAFIEKSAESGFAA